LEKNVKISMLLDLYGSLLTDKQFNLLNDYYNNDYTLSEIAENEGITRQAVRDNLIKGENNLLEYDGKLKMLKKKENERSVIENSISLLEEISKRNKIDLEIKNEIDRIVKNLKKIDL